jgi:hypothetical protein
MDGSQNVRNRTPPGRKLEMAPHILKVTSTALVVALVRSVSSAEAQPVPKDATYWQSFIAAMKPGDTFKVQLSDGSSFTGELLSTTTDDMLILRDGAFLDSGVQQRVRFDAVKSLSQTHPIRDTLILGPIMFFAVAGAAVAVLVGFLAIGGS